MELVVVVCVYGGRRLKVTPWINKTDCGQVSEVMKEGGFLGSLS